MCCAAGSSAGTRAISSAGSQPEAPSGRLAAELAGEAGKARCSANSTTPTLALRQPLLLLGLPDCRGVGDTRGAERGWFGTDFLPLTA